MRMTKPLLSYVTLAFMFQEHCYVTNFSGEAFSNEILCEILFLEAITFSFSQILILEIWAKRGGYHL